MPIRALIFDLDGTLADTLRVCIQAYQHTFEKYLPQYVPADEIEAHFGRSEEGILKSFLPDHDQEEILSDYIVHYKRLHRPLQQPFPGIMAVLDLLHSRNIRTAIVTGKGERSAVVSMRELGLSPFFERLEWGHPDYNNKTENILRILSDWRIDPADVAYVGDTTGDMHAAAEAGVLPLGAAWGETATVVENDGAARLFHSVEEFQHWVEKNTRG
jgi:phosphoglycolate phosphatase-like HAD superfamily hydrolase